MLPRLNLTQYSQQPFLNTIFTGQIAQSQRFPSPIGGWNVYDSIAAMDPTYALTLTNMFPTVRDCHVRGGFVPWATGMTGQVETLIQWGGNTGSKMLAAANRSIYDVTKLGAVGAPLSAGYTNNRWQTVNFGGPGGQFIVAVNGFDTPWNYDGTTVSSSPAITGVDPTTLINVAAFQQRLFFVISNSLSYAYLPVTQIGGAALTVDLSSFFPLGGYLVCIGSWSRAGLTDQQDLCVFLTNKGEFVIFEGNDPADAANWSLQNRGRIGAPVGPRSMQQIGTDLYIVCQDGLVALSEVLWLDRVDVSKTISIKIGTAINDAIAAYGGNFGWQAFLYPRGNQVMVNVPITEGYTIQQYVVNTSTGAWCNYTNLNANCWVLYNENPYFGSTDGTVYQWDKGHNDNGSSILWEARRASNNMGIQGQNKLWTFVKPIFTFEGETQIMFDFEVDFDMTAITETPVTPVITGAQWNVAQWNEAQWTSGVTTQGILLTPNAIGIVGTIHMKGAAKNQTVSWLATDYTYIQAGLM